MSLRTESGNDFICYMPRFEFEDSEPSSTFSSRPPTPTFHEGPETSSFESGAKGILPTGKRVTSKAPGFPTKNKAAQWTLLILGILALGICGGLLVGMVPHGVSFNSMGMGVVSDTLASASQTALIISTVGAGVLGVGCGAVIVYLRRPAAEQEELAPKANPLIGAGKQLYNDPKLESATRQVAVESPCWIM